MKLVSPQRVAANPNFACDISADKQDELRIGNAQFIVSLCQDLQLSQECVAVAIVATNIFFL